ncbi:MAG TPA: DUF3617 family protein [Sphingomicrobium sp.]|nr:DUF3617 family protein [Sphingomicrobium sp.]
MRDAIRFGLAGLLFCGATALAATSSPRALAPAIGGLWEVSHSATGRDPVRLCVPAPEMLAQFEHRQGNCTRSLVNDRGSSALFHYQCSDGGFGQANVTLITPRALRIDTQGISAGLPFHYKLHARRVGDCPR